MVLISSTTIGTAVSSIVVNNAFSATYENYRIVLSGGAHTTGATAIQMNLNGITSGYYAVRVNMLYGNTAITGYKQDNSTKILVADVSTYGATGAFNVYSPFSTRAKTGDYWALPLGTLGGYAMCTGGWVNLATTSCTGFTLTLDSGAMTGGTIKVYGYKK
jgi:hypothetical protein